MTLLEQKQVLIHRRVKRVPALVMDIKPKCDPHRSSSTGCTPPPHVKADAVLQT